MELRRVPPLLLEFYQPQPSCPPGTETLVENFSVDDIVPWEKIIRQVNRANINEMILAVPREVIIKVSDCAVRPDDRKPEGIIHENWHHPIL